MKKLKCLISLFTLIVCSTTLSAQYQSIFGAQQSSWYFNSWVATPEFVHCIPDSTWVLYNQDTSFQGKVYKPHYILDGNSSTPYNNGFVSEDTTTGELWFRKSGSFDTTIYKIMDMSLTVNDSFYLDQGLGGSMIPVDSIYYQNSRKHIKLDYYQGVYSGPPYRTTLVYYTMIEGVGVNLSGVSLSFGNTILKRSWKDNSLDYIAPLDSVFYCDTLTSLAERKNKTAAFEIFPNPVGETAKLSLKELNAEKLELIDLSGRLVKSFSTKEKELNFSDISNGVYFVRVTTTKQEQFSQKVVVQK